MDYGRTVTQPLTDSTLPDARGGMVDSFGSAITSGVGSAPEGVNPDLENSLDVEHVTNRTEQASLGARTLNIDSYLPSEVDAHVASVAGITEATRADNIDELGRPMMLTEERSMRVSDDQPMQSMKDSGIVIETVTPPEPESDNKTVLDFGKHLKIHDVKKIIDNKSLSELYSMIQNTREKNALGGNS